MAANLSLKRTTSDDPDFRGLVSMLDADLAHRDGKDAPFFAQYNKIDSIKHVVVAYYKNEPAGCGAFKHYENDTVEVKRMYVEPGCRGNGIARAVLAELEMWAGELGFNSCILETGK